MGIDQETIQKLKSKYGENLKFTLVLYDLEPLFNIRTGVAWRNGGFGNKDFDLTIEGEAELYKSPKGMIGTHVDVVNDIKVFFLLYKRKMPNRAFYSILSYLKTGEQLDVLKYLFEIKSKIKKVNYRIGRLREFYENRGKIIG